MHPSKKFALLKFNIAVCYLMSEFIVTYVHIVLTFIILLFVKHRIHIDP